MNAKHLSIPAVLAAISIAATAWALHTSAPTVASDRHGENVVPSLLAKANDITALSMRDGADTLTIERRDNRFVASDSGYPVKTDAVSDVVASSAGLTFQEARTSDPTRYGDLGLADPGAKDAGKEITFRTAGGELASFLVGNSDTTVGGPTGGVFIRLKGSRRRSWCAATSGCRLAAVRVGLSPLVSRSSAPRSKKSSLPEGDATA